MRIITGLSVLLIIIFFASCKKENDNVYPWIELKGTNPVYTELGKPYEDAGAIAMDINASGDTVDISYKLQIFSNVNVDEIGEYQVFYNVEDDAGNKAEPVVRTVYVQIFK